EFRRRLNRKISRLLALENTVDIAGCGLERFDIIRSEGNQATAGRVVMERIDCGQLVLRRKRDDQSAMNRCPSTGHDDQATIGRAGKGTQAALDPAGITGVDSSHLHAEHLRCASYGAEQGERSRIGGIAEHSDPCHAWCNLLEEFK